MRELKERGGREGEREGGGRGVSHTIYIQPEQHKAFYLSKWKFPWEIHY